jgi:hypothetical protein
MRQRERNRIKQKLITVEFARVLKQKDGDQKLRERKQNEHAMTLNAGQEYLVDRAKTKPKTAEVSVHKVTSFFTS